MQSRVTAARVMSIYGESQSRTRKLKETLKNLIAKNKMQSDN